MAGKITKIVSGADVALLTLLLFAHVATAASPPASPTPVRQESANTDELSSAEIYVRFVSLSNQIDQDVEKVNGAVAIANALSSVDPSRYDLPVEQELAPILERLATSLDEWMRADAKGESRPPDDLLKAAQELKLLVDKPVKSIVSSIYNSMKKTLGEGRQLRVSDPEAIDVWNDIARFKLIQFGKHTAREYRMPLERSVPRVHALLSQIGVWREFVPSFDDDDLAPEESVESNNDIRAAAREELRNPEDVAKELRKSLLGFVDDAKASLDLMRPAWQRTIDARNVAIGEARRRAADLRKQSLAKDVGQERRQSELTGWVPIIVVFLLGSMITSLLIIRWKNDDLAVLFVRERVGVEMISIGSFLSVVLFLGAGDFVQRETLGTLLGTLAGYLFTRRGSGVYDGSVPYRGLPPGAPGLPTWDPATSKVALTEKPPRATSIAVWLRSLASGSVERLGSTGDTAYVIPAGKLARGADYEVWFVAENDAGESESGRRLSFKA